MLRGWCLLNTLKRGCGIAALVIMMWLPLLQLAVVLCSLPGRVLGTEVRPRRFK